MKAIVCELCGSNDIIKQDGLFVCQHCGTKYTTEEAKKLLGVVKIDKTETVNNLLVLSRRAIDDKDFSSALKYYEEILKEQPENFEALMFRYYCKALETKGEKFTNNLWALKNFVDGELCNYLLDIPIDDDGISMAERIILCSASLYIHALDIKDNSAELWPIDELLGVKLSLLTGMDACQCVVVKYNECEKITTDGLYLLKKFVEKYLELCDSSDMFWDRVKSVSAFIKETDPTYIIPEVFTEIQQTDEKQPADQKKQGVETSEKKQKIEQTRKEGKKSISTLTSIKWGLILGMLISFPTVVGSLLVLYFVFKLLNSNGKK